MKYIINKKILKDIISIETEKIKTETLDMSVGFRDYLMKQRKINNIFFSAMLVGYNLDYSQAAQIANYKLLLRSNEQEKLLNNLKNSIDYVMSEANATPEQLNLNKIIHLHKMLLSDIKDEWFMNIRAHDQTPNAEYDDWTGLALVSPTKIHNALLEAIDRYNLSTDQYKIFDILYLILNMTEIQPFVYYNKFTTILLFIYLLNNSAYLQKTFFSPLKMITANLESIVKLLANADSTVDCTSFFEGFIGIIADEFVQTRKYVMLELNKYEQNKKEKPFLDLNHRQLKILKYLQTVKNISREDYIMMLEVSTMTAYRDLNELVKRKLLKVVGNGRGTKYMLASM